MSARGSYQRRRHDEYPPRQEHRASDAASSFMRHPGSSSRQQEPTPYASYARGADRGRDAMMDRDKSSRPSGSTLYETASYQRPSYDRHGGATTARPFDSDRRTEGLERKHGVPLEDGSDRHGMYKRPRLDIHPPSIASLPPKPVTSAPPPTSSSKGSYTRKQPERQRARSRSVDSVGRVRRERSLSVSSTSSREGRSYRRQRSHSPRQRSPPGRNQPPKGNRYSGTRDRQMQAPPRRDVNTRPRSPHPDDRSFQKRNRQTYRSPNRPNVDDNAKRRGRSRSPAPSPLPVYASRERGRSPDRYGAARPTIDRMDVVSPSRSPSRSRSVSPRARSEEQTQHQKGSYVRRTQPDMQAQQGYRRDYTQPDPHQNQYSTQNQEHWRDDRTSPSPALRITPINSNVNAEGTNTIRLGARIPADRTQSSLGPGFKRTIPRKPDPRSQVRKFFPVDEDDPVASRPPSPPRAPSAPLDELPPPPAPMLPPPGAFAPSMVPPPGGFAENMPPPPGGFADKMPPPLPPTEPLPPATPTPHATAEPTSAFGTNGSLPATPIAPAAPQTKDVYERLIQVGEGTYGKVYKARNIEDGSLVALKRIRMEAEKDGFPITSVREIKLLQSLKHENVMMLSEMMVSRGSVFMVFEYMDHDLTGLLRCPQVTFTAAHCKSLMSQLLHGLAYIHQRGVLHRDLKGSNILLNKQGCLKIGDFGLARFYQKDRGNDYTNRVITQWYKPPELLYGATVYGAEVDVWSAGCIFLELFTKRPVFQGTDEINQLDVIFKLRGTPDVATWPSLYDLPWYELLKPKETIPDRFKSMFGQKYLKTDGAIELAEALLSMDPRGRPTAEESLSFKYFSEEPAAEVPTTVLEQVNGDWHELEAKGYAAASKSRKQDAAAQAKKRSASKTTTASHSTDGGSTAGPPGAPKLAERELPLQ